jgi:hypothetical protein
MRSFLYQALVVLFDFTCVAHLYGLFAMQQETHPWVLSLRSFFHCSPPGRGWSFKCNRSVFLAATYMLIKAEKILLRNTSPPWRGAPTD